MSIDSTIYIDHSGDNRADGEQETLKFNRDEEGNVTVVEENNFDHEQPAENAEVVEDIEAVEDDTQETLPAEDNSEEATVQEEAVVEEEPNSEVVSGSSESSVEVTEAPRSEQQLQNPEVEQEVAEKTPDVNMANTETAPEVVPAPETVTSSENNAAPEVVPAPEASEQTAEISEEQKQQNAETDAKIVKEINDNNADAPIEQMIQSKLSAYPLPDQSTSDMQPLNPFE